MAIALYFIGKVRIQIYYKNHLAHVVIIWKFVDGLRNFEQYEDELPILIAMRYGEYSWEKIFRIIDGYEKSFKVAAQLNKLPAYPDEERVNQLLLKIYYSKQ